MSEVPLYSHPAIERCEGGKARFIKLTNTTVSRQEDNVKKTGCLNSGLSRSFKSFRFLFRPTYEEYSAAAALQSPYRWRRILGHSMYPSILLYPSILRKPVCISKQYVSEYSASILAQNTSCAEYSGVF